MALSPLNQRRWRNFRANRRAFWSLILFSILYGISLGAEVVAIGCSPDGLNINHEVGATHPQALVDAVRTHKADFGVALDGDADRLQLVDAQGRLFNGDELLYLLADDRLGRDEHVPGVVGTLMTNMAVEVALKARGGA